KRMQLDLKCSIFISNSVPFTKLPQQAAPPTMVVRLLTALAAEPRNCVALISGRPAEDLDRWFGAIRGVWLVAEHGAELKTVIIKDQQTAAGACVCLLD